MYCVIKLTSVSRCVMTSVCVDVITLSCVFQDVLKYVVLLAIVVALVEYDVTQLVVVEFDVVCDALLYLLCDDDPICFT